ncbi:MAG: 2-phosphosulfolactate phosphatase [Acidimicrobiia bacterium]|nr:2-phosphosulfolactate phosphatase [Acidimicrobiia bacterium]
MDRITFLQGVDGAEHASGATVIIDTFRAFTTAAVLLAGGVGRLFLVDTIPAARSLAGRTGALLCGEEQGRKPPDFDLPNSPYEVGLRTDLAGAAVVQRTSAGTRSVVAAIRSGARPVFASSLVVAGATADAVQHHPAISLVSAGLHGTLPADEDDLTARHIAAILVSGSAPHHTADAVRECSRARELAQAPWAHPDDVTIAADLDRFDFAMEAIVVEDTIELVATRT